MTVQAKNHIESENGVFKTAFYILCGRAGGNGCSGTAGCFYLCDEGIRMGKRFTGAMTGIYAVAGEQKLYADFSHFIYQDIE